jgi:hypothetical protein
VAVAVRVVLGEVVVEGDVAFGGDFFAGLAEAVVLRHPHDGLEAIRRRAFLRSAVEHAARGLNEVFGVNPAFERVLVRAADEDRAAPDRADDVAAEDRVGDAVAIEVAEAEADEAGCESPTQPVQARLGLRQAQFAEHEDFGRQGVGRRQG